jgi:predicted acyl esterase
MSLASRLLARMAGLPPALTRRLRRATTCNAGESFHLDFALTLTHTPGRLSQRADDTICVRVELSSTACCFRRGHRLRLQVSSGAHPRFSRNPGAAEPLGTATTLSVAHQEVFHDPEHPSVVILPVRTTG